MRWFLGTLLALIIAVGIYLGSAVVSLARLAEAAKAADAAEVLARTDVVRLRRSLVDQIVSAYLKQLGRDRPVKPLERLAANTYGASVADAMIARMLTAENLTDLLNKGAINSDGNAIARMRSLSELDTSNVLETLRGMSLIKPVELMFSLGEGENAGGVSLHFEGDGWKLSGIQLPSAAVQVLAQNLINKRAG
ncbi:DUF2939 domain-containing protein [Bradyrhizobium sp.]|uniref:DUF2939 domain-containing protein n=1 Tax=Bradyrhizobium sp. TaxID=376 RepID=UPI002736DCC0|nr:DUF2939 domain-containing protein [Bradyrhizobium sp.]MDP3689501.1 DUF2939 domain-containing protein [Bradyrhizobium sp.]